MTLLEPIEPIEPVHPNAGHTCPGGCGRHCPPETVACPECYRYLPSSIRTALASTWGTDWPAHGRTLTDALLWFAAHRYDRWERTYARLEEDDQ